MREVDWEKERSRLTAVTPFKIAAIICGGIGLTCAGAAVGYRVYESVEKKEVVVATNDGLDADKSTKDIDLMPMP